jgi:putative membrane protein
MNTYSFFGMHLAWWLLWLILFWIIITPYDLRGRRRKKETPLDILQRRLATGEIDIQEYQNRKKLLENDSI